MHISWLWRGFQSAIFYYVSCAPCAKLSYRRHRRKEIKRAKEEKAATEMEQGIYHHPSPFSTNIYWREEMRLGPGPPQKKGNRDRKSESRRELRSGGVGSSSMTGTSSDTVVEDHLNRNSHERRGGEDWNKRRYQREDEMLWGVDGDGNDFSDIVNRSGIGSYYYARNPAVNDLHPPVVSTQPTRRSETRWMLQPPPTARIMEGKDQSPRSRSESGVSSKSGDSSRKRHDVSLVRKVGERLMEEKVRRVEYPYESATTSASMLRLPSGESGSSEHYHMPQGQRHDREALLSPFSPESHSASNSPPDESLNPRRPPLPTIPSSSAVLVVTRSASVRNSSTSLPAVETVNPFSSSPPPEPQPNTSHLHSSDSLTPSLLKPKPAEENNREGLGWWWPVDWGIRRREDDDANGQSREVWAEDRIVQRSNPRGRWSVAV